jgi:hypothetical protein
MISGLLSADLLVIQITIIIDAFPHGTTIF